LFGLLILFSLLPEFDDEYPYGLLEGLAMIPITIIGSGVVYYFIHRQRKLRGLYSLATGCLFGIMAMDIIEHFAYRQWIQSDHTVEPFYWNNGEASFILQALIVIISVVLIYVYYKKIIEYFNIKVFIFFSGLWSILSTVTSVGFTYSLIAYMIIIIVSIVSKKANFLSK
jgi:hypothetical protein